jgi:hypothetical protein
MTVVASWVPTRENTLARVAGSGLAGTVDVPALARALLLSNARVCGESPLMTLPASAVGIAVTTVKRAPPSPLQAVFPVAIGAAADRLDARLDVDESV